jgi:ParB family chromosome partitioning protein
MSAQNKHGLGRGLEALFGDEDIDLNLDGESKGSTGGIKMLSMKMLKAGKFQPRRSFNLEAIHTLAESIKEKGILQPILVRKVGEGYEIIAGERRFRAAQEAGLEEVPVIEKEFSDNEALEVALIENIVRQDLSPIDEAYGLDRLLRQFSYTQEKLGQVVGYSRSRIANSLRLLSLPTDVKKMVNEGKLTAGHARTLVGLENAAELAGEIIKNDLSVRQTEELIAKYKNNKEKQTVKKEKAPKDQDLTNIEAELSKKFGLKVQINAGQKGKGKVILMYNDLSELEKIIDQLEQ